MDALEIVKLIPVFAAAVVLLEKVYGQMAALLKKTYA